MSNKRKELFVPLSPKAQQLLQTTTEQWETAQLTLPGSIRIKLNVHQIYTLLEWDIDFTKAKKAFNIDVSKQAIVHRFAWREGVIHHCYYV